MQRKSGGIAAAKGVFSLGDIAVVRSSDEASSAGNDWHFMLAVHKF